MEQRLDHSTLRAAEAGVTSGSVDNISPVVGLLIPLLFKYST